MQSACFQKCSSPVAPGSFVNDSLKSDCGLSFNIMKGLFKKQGSSTSTNNPYPLARCTLVEVLHCIEQLMHLIDHLLLEGFEYEEPAVTCKAREGAATLEAPRGVLLHAYSHDKESVLKLHSESECSPNGCRLGLSFICRRPYRCSDNRSL
jgi:hypothetical protein